MCEQLRSKSLFSHRHSDPGMPTIPLEKFLEVARVSTDKQSFINTIVNFIFHTHILLSAYLYSHFKI